MSWSKWVVVAGLFFLSAGAFAQTAPAPLSILQGRPDEIDNSSLTGPVFNDPLQGISLRPPAQAQTVRENQTAGDIVQFVNKDLGWVLKVSRAQMPRPIALATAAGKSGLLDLTIQQFKAANPSAKILQQHVEHIGQYDCALLVARYTQAAQVRLMQQAIFHFSDSIYYVLTMTSPGSDTQAPEEQRATHTFDQVIQSVQLIDRAKIKEDQDQRLLRSRDFLNSLTTEKIRSVLVPEQFERITQNGHDIGYRYITESQEKRFGKDGIRIGVRTHLEAANSTKIDSEAWLTSSFDRKQEEWSLGTLTTNAKGEKNAISELGTSTQYTKRVFDPVHGKTDPSDPGQPPVRVENIYELRVTQITTNGTSQPTIRELPPFYVPQALGYLLPGLLASEPGKTFMFAVWSDPDQEVLARYLEVGQPEPSTQEGKKIIIIPVADRLRLEGSPMTHYITADGKELWSRDANGVNTIPCDRAALVDIWKTPNLTPPGGSSR